MPIYNIYPKRRGSFFNSLSITTLLILINILAFSIFLFLLAFGNSENLYNYIALKPINVLNGKFLWTFFTSMFMHAGFFHILANMLSLFFIGTLVERILGRKRYILFYLISGLFAGIFFVFSSWILSHSFGITGDYETFAVGASGALFGLVGLLMLLTPDLPVYIMFIPIPVRMKYAAPGILIVLWVISITADVGIGNTAHLGGLIAGLIYGIYLRKIYRNKTKRIREFFR